MLRCREDLERKETVCDRRTLANRLIDRQATSRLTSAIDARFVLVSSISLDAPLATRTRVLVNHALIFDEARGLAICARIRA
jgi:hypothetical protein